MSDWKCPVCAEKFPYYEVLTDSEHASKSLAVHIYIEHGATLMVTDSRKCN